MSTLLSWFSPSLTAVWTVTILHLLGIAGGAFLAMGSVISIANMRVSWVGALLLMAFGVPVMFGLSVIGAWWVYFADSPAYFIYIVALPWVFLVAFIAAMVISFRFVEP